MNYLRPNLYRLKNTPRDSCQNTLSMGRVLWVNPNRQIRLLTHCPTVGWGENWKGDSSPVIFILSLDIVRWKILTHWFFSYINNITRTIFSWYLTGGTEPEVYSVSKILSQLDVFDMENKVIKDVMCFI